jgi:citrate/tricarballylate utilization protein
MQSLEALTRAASALANGTNMGAPGLSAPEIEVARQLQICNACRYCEGFCAVFPAMTQRLEFGKADVHYLSNLCHNCGACLHACQYAPPHEFAVNVPQAMAKLRLQTYSDYAWPAPLGALYQRNGLTLSLALALGLALFLVLALALNGALLQVPPTGSFYAVFPHYLLVILFAPVFLFAVVALGLGVRRFWRDLALINPATPVAVQDAVSGAAALDAAVNVLRLKYLDGGHGEGCNNADDAWTLWRRRFHHATFYGFLLCFAATLAATLYHYLLGWDAPFEWPSLPKLLGVPGGIGLLLGTAGLFTLNRQRHPLHGDAAQKPMDLGFMALLFFTSLSGLTLWLGRSSVAMPALLAAHLGAVMALFATLPYGKFAHGIFRAAALLKWAIEKRQADKLKLRT